MGRGKRPGGAGLLECELPLSDGDGRSRLQPARATVLPGLGLKLAVQDLGGSIDLAEGEEPLLRLDESGERVLVYGQGGRTLVGNLGLEPAAGALLAQCLREGHALKAEVAKRSGGWGGPLELELYVEVY